MMRFYGVLLFALWLVGVFMVGCGDNPVADNPDDPENEETSNTGERAEIHGLVLPPGVGAQVIVLRNGAGFKSTLTDDEGRYTIKDLPGGEYSMQVIATGFFTDISISHLELQKGETREVDLVILREQSAAATLSGQVINKSTQEPMPDVEVQIECSSGVCAPLSAVSDEDGQFAIKIWSGLESNINVRKPGYRIVPIEVKALAPNQNFNLGQIQLERIEP